MRDDLGKFWTPIGPSTIEMPVDQGACLMDHSQTV
jgi:hypothetical protein